MSARVIKMQLAADVEKRVADFERRLADLALINTSSYVALVKKDMKQLRKDVDLLVKHVRDAEEERLQKTRTSKRDNIVLFEEFE